MTIFKRFKKGIRELRPEQLAYSKVVGNFGNVIGLILAVGALFYQGLWYWSVFLLSMVWLQSIELVSSIQKYESLKEMMEEINNGNDG